jgi:uncharacterized cupredoxin-like copper-binding protein
MSIFKSYSRGSKVIHLSTPCFAYQYTRRNEGQKLHEFTIAKKVPGGNQGDRDAASVKDVDDIQPGQTSTFDLTFKEPAPSVGMEFECSYPGHYEMGMHLDITVQ